MKQKILTYLIGTPLVLLLFVIAGSAPESYDELAAWLCFAGVGAIIITALAWLLKKVNPSLFTEDETI